MFASCRRSAASLGNSLSRSLLQPLRFQTPCTGHFVTNSSITPTPFSYLSNTSNFCFTPSVFCLQTRAASNGNVQTKLKPKKSAVKRFKVTATGKLLHSRSGKQHLAVKKSGHHIGTLSRKALVSDADATNIKRLLGLC